MSHTSTPFLDQVTRELVNRFVGLPVSQSFVEEFKPRNELLGGMGPDIPILGIFHDRRDEKVFFHSFYEKQSHEDIGDYDYSVTVDYLVVKLCSYKRDPQKYIDRIRIVLGDIERHCSHDETFHNDFHTNIGFTPLNTINEENFITKYQELLSRCTTYKENIVPVGVISDNELDLEDMRWMYPS